MNVELSHLNDWFYGNNLSLNTVKTKYVMFHKEKSKDNLPSVLPDLIINYTKTKRENSLKFVGVMIDENLTWKTRVELVENKISKSVGILYKASRFLTFSVQEKLKNSIFEMAIIPQTLNIDNLKTKVY